MEHEDARALIAGGESVTCEFKRGSINDKALVEAVTCLANGEGGVLFVGVEDDGTVTGVKPRHGQVTDPDLIRALILNRTSPPCPVESSVITLDGHEVLAVRVTRADGPVGTVDGVYKRRTVQMDGRPQCVPYLPHEMFSRFFSMTGQDYAETAVRGATIDDLDPAEFQRLREKAASGHGDRALVTLNDLELGRALGVLRDSGTGDAEITVGAILLFGTEGAVRRFVPNAEVAFQETKNTKVLVNRFETVPILRAADFLHDEIMSRNPEEELQWGMLRIGIPRVPETVVREIVANALVHRDYTEPGAVRVVMDEHELSVHSPGGFPHGVTIDNIMDVSRPRSKTIADAFKRAGLAERTGRGVGIMFNDLLRAGRNVPYYHRNSPGIVIASITNSPADHKMVRFILEYEKDSGRSVSRREIQILHQLRATGSSTTGELCETTMMNPETVRSVAADLTAKGIIETRGTGRGRVYHIASAFYRYAGEPAGYVRIRGNDGIQQEHMVLRYVNAYGSITRAEAAELCALSPAAAGRLLQRLVKEGRLALHGERRWARYLAPDNQDEA